MGFCLTSLSFIQAVAKSCYLCGHNIPRIRNLFLIVLQPSLPCIVLIAFEEIFLLLPCILYSLAQQQGDLRQSQIRSLHSSPGSPPSPSMYKSSQILAVTTGPSILCFCLTPLLMSTGVHPHHSFTATPKLQTHLQASFSGGWNTTPGSWGPSSDHFSLTISTHVPPLTLTFLHPSLIHVSAGFIRKGDNIIHSCVSLLPVLQSINSTG